MTNSLQLGGLYVLMAAMLMIGTLMPRRGRPARLFSLTLFWLLFFGAGFVLLSFRDNLGLVGARLRAEAFGTPVTQGRETRIPMAIDGHFWVDARVNGGRVKFLVDSGATMITLDRTTARSLGVEILPGRDQYVRTGNGIIRVASGRAARLTVGGIKRRDVGIQITDHDDLNVLGMNFLSSLSRWGVEGRWLVMVS